MPPPTNEPHIRDWARSLHRSAERRFLRKGSGWTTSRFDVERLELAQGILACVSGKASTREVACQLARPE